MSLAVAFLCSPEGCLSSCHPDAVCVICWGSLLQISAVNIFFPLKGHYLAFSNSQKVLPHLCVHGVGCWLVFWGQRTIRLDIEGERVMSTERHIEDRQMER